LDAVGVEVLEQDVAAIVDAPGLGERRAGRLGHAELAVPIAHEAAQGQRWGSGAAEAGSPEAMACPVPANASVATAVAAASATIRWPVVIFVRELNVVLLRSA
jgi:hypothetical protein